MASQPDILQLCLQEASNAAKPALERCINDAVAALQLAETLPMKPAHRDEVSAAWREMLRSKGAWSQQYSADLEAKFKGFVAAADLARQAPVAAGSLPVLSAPTLAGYTSSKLAALTQDMFTLVDDADVAHAIEKARLLQQVLPVVEHSLAELNVLISSVQGLSNVKPEFNPLRPDVFTQVLQDITSAVGMTPTINALCMKHLAGPLAHELNTIYKYAVQHLERAHVQSVNYRVIQAPSSPAMGSISRSAGTSNGGSSSGIQYGGGGNAAFEASQVTIQPPPADLSNEKVHHDLLQDFLFHGGSRADEALAPSYYAIVDKELVSLKDQTDSAFASPDRRQSRYASLAVVDRPQREVGERSELDSQVWGAYGMPRERALLRTQLKKKARRVGQVLGLEVVLKLVNQVAQDARLLAPVREAVIALEPSLLRLAMVDPRFFSDESHPGRRLMERVAQRSFKFNDEFSAEFQAFFGPVVVAFNTLNTQLIENVQPFGRALAALEYDWNQQDQQELAYRAKVLKALRFAEDRQKQADQIAFDMSHRSDLEKVPGIVLDFLFGPWALVLAQAKLMDTRQQLDPQGFGSVVSDLLWSTKREVILKQPAKLIEMIPGLLGKLHEGLDLLGHDPQENETFFENLLTLHRPVLKLRRLKSQQDVYKSEAIPRESEEPGTAPARRQAKTTDYPWLRREDLDQAGFEDTLPSMHGELMRFDNEPQTLSQAASAPGLTTWVNGAPLEATACSDSEADEILLRLQVGHWVDIYSRRRWLRSQLIWASSPGTLFMFISHDGQPHSMTQRSGKRLIRQNLLRPVESHSVVAQALDKLAKDSSSVQA